MLEVTDNAIGHLAQMLRQVEAPRKIAIRLVILGDKGITMIQDKILAEDTTYDYEDQTVLVVDEQVEELLDEKTLDVVDSGQGPKLAIV